MIKNQSRGSTLNSPNKATFPILEDQKPIEPKLRPKIHAPAPFERASLQMQIICLPQMVTSCLPHPSSTNNLFAPKEEVEPQTSKAPNGGERRYLATSTIRATTITHLCKAIFFSTCLPSNLQSISSKGFLSLESALTSKVLVFFKQKGWARPSKPY